jgi:hypothetical protein
MIFGKTEVKIFGMQPGKPEGLEHVGEIKFLP